MEEQAPRLRTTTTGDVVVVELVDKKILDEASIARLSEQLSALAAQQVRPAMVLDFINVAHMSSSALGVLISLHKRVREKGGTIVLCNIRPSIYEVFVITRLSEVFRITQTRQEALRELKA